jgi:hypothetical protein
VLFYKSRANAEDMVKAGVAYQLSAEPFEIRLAKAPTSREHEALLRPDRSLAMGPDVMRGAAKGIASCQALLNSWRGATLLAGRDESGKPLWAGSKITPVVPQALIDAGHQGSILYMPKSGRWGHMKVGEKIRRARIAFGLSQVTLSLRLEKSQIWVSRLERGTQKATPEVIDQVFSAIRARQGLRETVKA